LVVSCILTLSEGVILRILEVSAEVKIAIFVLDPQMLILGQRQWR
jgi:hypothetical protein